MLSSSASLSAPVLGLREQVGGARAAVGRRVGDHDDLARAGRQIDPDAARDEELRGRDVGVPGPDDPVDGAIDAVPYASAATACAPPIA